MDLLKRIRHGGHLGAKGSFRGAAALRAALAAACQHRPMRGARRSAATAALVGRRAPGPGRALSSTRRLRAAHRRAVVRAGTRSHDSDARRALCRARQSRASCGSDERRRWKAAAGRGAPEELEAERGCSAHAPGEGCGALRAARWRRGPAAVGDEARGPVAERATRSGGGVSARQGK